MNKLATLQPNWPIPEHVKVHSTTRQGGVSKPPYNSLNLGLHVEDEARDVYRNRETLSQHLCLPTEPLWMKQVHGVDVFELSKATPNAVCADAAYTEQVNQVITVVTADCLPVVLTNKSGSAISVIHAGWRGLAAGILHNAQARFNANEALFAWMAPAIGAQKFEVGAEVYEVFTDRLAHNKQAFEALGGGKYLADLYALARNDMNAYRDTQVYGGEYCTYTQSELFHSYRRDGVRSGRMATLAWLA